MHHGGAERQPGRPVPDGGVSLVEIIISVVLIGLVLTSVLAAVQMSVRASSVANTAVQVETVLLNASDRIARAPQRCDYEQYVDAAGAGEGWAAEKTSASVEIMIAKTGAPSDWAPQSCPDDISAFEVQRITITATDPDDRVTRTRTVVKSSVE